MDVLKGHDEFAFKQNLLIKDDNGENLFREKARASLALNFQNGSMKNISKLN